jgi:hypothetical protein
MITQTAPECISGDAGQGSRSPSGGVGRRLHREIESIHRAGRDGRPVHTGASARACQDHPGRCADLAVTTGDRRSATPSRSSSQRSTDTSSVMDAFACPSMRCTTSTLAPALTARLAVVCGKSCGVMDGNLLFIHELTGRGVRAYASDPGMTSTDITRRGWLAAHGSGPSDAVHLAKPGPGGAGQHPGGDDGPAQRHLSRAAFQPAGQADDDQATQEGPRPSDGPSAVGTFRRADRLRLAGVKPTAGGVRSSLDHGALRSTTAVVGVRRHSVPQRAARFVPLLVLIAARVDAPAGRTRYFRAAGPPPTTHSRAVSASAVGNTRHSPGIRIPKNFVARLIHSTPFHVRDERRVPEEVTEAELPTLPSGRAGIDPDETTRGAGPQSAPRALWTHRHDRRRRHPQPRLSSRDPPLRLAEEGGASGTRRRFRRCRCRGIRVGRGRGPIALSAEKRVTPKITGCRLHPPRAWTRPITPPARAGARSRRRRDGTTRRLSTGRCPR